jgi:hypothetical protein
MFPETIIEKKQIYQALEDDFTSTVIRELMPGILHNFANPLNGIMGRSKLLQKRMDDALKKINEKYPETASAMQDEFQRIKNDIHSINKESDSFFDIFRDASGKFYALVAKGEGKIDISQLLAGEARFTNFYLDFKHEITKNVSYDTNLPYIKGNEAELSLVFWRLIRFAMTRALNSESKELFLTTQHDHEKITVLIKYSGDPVPEGDGLMISQYLQDLLPSIADVKMEKGVLLAFMILKKYLAQVQFSAIDGLNTISVAMPYAVSAG